MSAAMLLVAGLGGCDSLGTETTTPREAYLHYCASCHGEQGRGDGPLAEHLKRRPTDLTRLAERADGFDDKAVLAVVVGTRDVPEHGAREMPVWGAVFRDELEAESKRYRGYTALLKARSLVDYLRTIQED